ncbi:serine/threonine-protein kinase [uncultured Mycobacterium sp.]|uniref:serine/threonine-protein kinase n=1 Tax=uncultured Mycobacterium sp. TaxID=171292 RepID=UPI0035CC7C8A
MPLAPGSTFAGYTIVRMLGTGGTGEVYLAQHPALARQDALKVLPRSMTADRKFRERFHRETEIAATLYHPHIVEVYGRGEFDGQLWIAMEYLNGITAAQLMREQFPAGMPAGEALSIIAAIAWALDYAHQRAMLHRAVKPANIFLTNPGGGEPRILLADFGLARQIGTLRRLARKELTPDALAYAAPEQLTGSRIDGRADQYGLAATAFHLLTGAPPYQDVDISQRRSAAPPTLGDRHPDLWRLDGALSTALAENPADRFGSCRQFADALSGMAGVSVGDRSPEAVLTLDYPDDARVARQADAGELPYKPRGGVIATLVRRLPRRRATVAVPASRRWPWILLGSAVGVVLTLVGVLAGVMLSRKTQAPSTPVAIPTTRTSTAAPAPTTKSAAPGPGDMLDGTYQVDVNRAQQTYNDAPDPQPPNVTTWWAFRASCTPAGCVASGILLDDDNHQTVSTTAGTHVLVLDFRDGAWQSRPETVKFPCLGPHGTTANETTTQVISLQPQEHGPLRGVMTVTVETDECAQKGGQIVIPAVAGRVGDVPPGLVMPSPEPTTPTAPATTTRTR